MSVLDKSSNKDLCDKSNYEGKPTDTNYLERNYKKDEKLNNFDNVSSTYKEKLEINPEISVSIYDDSINNKISQIDKNSNFHLNNIYEKNIDNQQDFKINDIKAENEGIISKSLIEENLSKKSQTEIKEIQNNSEKNDLNSKEISSNPTNTNNKVDLSTSSSLEINRNRKINDKAENEGIISKSLIEENLSKKSQTEIKEIQNNSEKNDLNSKEISSNPTNTNNKVDLSTITSLDKNPKDNQNNFLKKNQKGSILQKVKNFIIYIMIEKKLVILTGFSSFLLFYNIFKQFRNLNKI